MNLKAFLKVFKQSAYSLDSASVNNVCVDVCLNVYVLEPHE